MEVSYQTYFKLCRFSFNMFFVRCKKKQCLCLLCQPAPQRAVLSPFMGFVDNPKNVHISDPHYHLKSNFDGGGIKMQVQSCHLWHEMPGFGSTDSWRVSHLLCVCQDSNNWTFIFFFISVWPQLQSIVRFLFKNKILHLNAFWDCTAECGKIGVFELKTKLVS